jgi:S-adenosylmethionine synthetase
MKKGSASDVEKEVAEVMDKELENIQTFSMELAAGKCPVC